MAGSDPYAAQLQEKEREANLGAISGMKASPTQQWGGMSNTPGLTWTQGRLSPQENVVVSSISKALFGRDIPVAQMTQAQWDQVQKDAGKRLANRPQALGIAPKGTSGADPAQQLSVQATLNNDMNALMQLFFPGPNTKAMSNAESSSLGLLSLAASGNPYQSVGNPTQLAQQVAGNTVQGINTSAAEQAYGQLPAQNVVTQNALPTGYAQSLLDALRYQTIYGGSVSGTPNTNMPPWLQSLTSLVQAGGSGLSPTSLAAQSTAAAPANG